MKRNPKKEKCDLCALFRVITPKREKEKKPLLVSEGISKIRSIEKKRKELREALQKEKEAKRVVRVEKEGITPNLLLYEPDDV